MHPIADGILAGLGAGSVFIVAGMMISAALSKPFLDPLRIISTMLLGRQALDPSYSFATDVVVGLISNIVLSGLFGLIFVFILMVHNCAHHLYSQNSFCSRHKKIKRFLLCTI